MNWTENFKRRIANLDSELSQERAAALAREAAEKAGEKVLEKTREQIALQMIRDIWDRFSVKYDFDLINKELLGGFGEVDFSQEYSPFYKYYWSSSGEGVLEV